MGENIIVAHVSTVHSWQDPRIFDKECCSLTQAGFEVHLITPDGNGEKVDGVQVHALNKKINNRFERFFIASKKIFQQALELNPDIIHFHDPELIPEALKVNKRSEVEIIYDIHEDNTTAIKQREYVPELIKPLIIKLVDYYEQRAYEDLHTIVAEKYYQERFAQATPILNYPVLDWLEERKNGPIYPGLIYTGNVREDRGALHHAEILSYISDVEVWSIGRCEESLYQQMKAKAGNRDDKLITRGVGDYVPFEKLVELYKSKNWLAGLALFPKSEHMQRKHLTKFFEYMAAGIPIIYSDMEEWKRLLEPLEVGVAVNPNDQNEIEEAILKLQNNTGLHNEMGRNGQKAVQEKFNWGQEEKKLIDFYNSL